MLFAQNNTEQVLSLMSPRIVPLPEPKTVSVSVGDEPPVPKKQRARTAVSSAIRSISPHTIGETTRVYNQRLRSTSPQQSNTGALSTDLASQQPKNSQSPLFSRARGLLDTVATKLKWLKHTKAPLRSEVMNQPRPRKPRPGLKYGPDGAIKVSSILDRQFAHVGMSAEANEQEAYDVLRESLGDMRVSRIYIENDDNISVYFEDMYNRLPEAEQATTIPTL